VNQQRKHFVGGVMSEAETKVHSRSFYKEWIEPFLIAAVVALFIRQFVVEAFKIPSGSMIPTLAVGDHLLVNKFIYGPRLPFTDIRIFTWEEPRRGDIIVFKFPQDESKDFIGLPGDKIQIINGKLCINDRAVKLTPVGPPADESVESGQSFGTPMFYDEQLGTITHEIQYFHDQSGENFGPKVVPQSSVFVMGDNRDNSQDSRFWGFVKYNKILGRALIIYWSWDGNDRWVRWERIGSLIK
jgi:signal peptidase I